VFRHNAKNDPIYCLTYLNLNCPQPFLKPELNCRDLHRSCFLRHCFLLLHFHNFNQSSLRTRTKFKSICANCCVRMYNTIITNVATLSNYSSRPQYCIFSYGAFVQNSDVRINDCVFSTLRLVQHNCLFCSIPIVADLSTTAVGWMSNKIEALGWAKVPKPETLLNQHFSLWCSVFSRFYWNILVYNCNARMLTIVSHIFVSNKWNFRVSCNL
jgi:hypothetical protein